MSSLRILVVRLSSMGDIIHTLPAVATLKHSFSSSQLWWLVARRWLPLVEGNPFVDRVVTFDGAGLRNAWGLLRTLRRERFSFAVDFQGLIRSALLASLARPERLYGFHQAEVREKPAALFYSTKVRTRSAHIVERNLELAAAAGASNILRAFHLPAGVVEGRPPEGPYVLACPLAGWTAKQWPMEYWAELAQRIRQELNMILAVSGPPAARAALEAIRGAYIWITSVAGLIYATRQAVAVVGVDSGPLHLAAALGKPGVAIFGPTDPARNGPYGSSFTVLRSPNAHISYKRRPEIAPSMREVTPQAVFDALIERLGPQGRGASGLA